MSEITVEDFKLMIIAIFKNKILIALVTMFGTFLGLLYTANQTSEYRYDAVASVCVTYSTYQEQLSGGSVMTNYSGIVLSNRVCRYAATLLEAHNLSFTPAQIQRMISVNISNNSYVMRIIAQSPSPQISIYVVNAVSEAFVSQVSNISGNQSIQVLDTADTASVVASGGLNQIRAGAAAISFLIICSAIALSEFLSQKVRSIAQCVEDEDEILAIIPLAE